MKLQDFLIGLGVTKMGHLGSTLRIENLRRDRMLTRHHILAVLVQCVLGVSVFHALGGAKFIGDDHGQVERNQLIRSLDQLPEIFLGSSFDSGGGQRPRGTYYKPVMTVTYALVHQVFGLSVTAFHMVLVGLGILNSILFYILLLNFVSKGWSLLAAMAFLVHPAHSEVLQYISNYQDALYMFFGLMAVNIEVRRERRAFGWWFVQTLCLLLATLSKETGLLFLPITVMAGLWLRTDRSVWGEAFVSILVLSVYAYLRIGLANMTYLQAHFTPFETASLSQRLTNMPAVMFYYFKSFVWPWPLSISQHWFYPRLTWSGFFIPLTGLILVAVSFRLLIRRFGKTAMFFVGVILVNLSLHSHIIALDATVADRWSYLTNLGLIALVVIALSSLNWAEAQVRALVPVFLVVILSMGVRTHLRNLDWQSEEGLLLRDLKYQPDSFAILSQLGFVYLNANRVEEACQVLEPAVRLAPAWWVSTNNLGVCHFRRQEWAQAEYYFMRSARLGIYHLAYENYVLLLLEQGRFKEARDIANYALTLFPGSVALKHRLEIAESELRLREY